VRGHREARSASRVARRPGWRSGGRPGSVSKESRPPDRETRSG
jgi:hypothetical protein